MGKKNQGFGARAKYSFDNFMSKGGFSVFSALMLMFFGAFVIMGAVRFAANYFLPEETLAQMNDQLWRVFLQISDAGAIAEDSDVNIVNKIVGIVTVFLGLVLFSSLVAFITSQFEAKLDELRKGKSSVIEKNHTLILGFGDRVLEIIREIIIANESEKKPSVVVLSEKEKDEMDDFFRDRIEDSKNTRVVCRSGSTSSLQMLKRVAVGDARSIIILNDAPADAPEEEKELADARVLKTIMAVISSTGEENLPPIVAELHLESKRKLALNLHSNICVIDEHSILAKLMVQTSRISGLAQVYDNLVGFDGCEFYFYRPESGIGGKKYSEVMFHFQSSSVLGVRKADGTLMINPLPDTICENDDEVILLAEDDSAIKYLKNPIKVSVPEGVPAPAQKQNPEKQLVVGWSCKAPVIVDEYSNYLVEGSSIDVIVEHINDDMRSEFEAVRKRHAKIAMSMECRDIHNPDVMKEIKPEKYDNVILLTGDGGLAELRDSETIAELLEFRYYFKNIGARDVKTQLITEVADSDNIEIIQEAGVKDFLISNQFVSKIYAQVSEEPDVLKVYDDLFCAEGSEVYIKPVTFFASAIPGKFTFGELCAAALKRNETAFGVRIKSEEFDADKHYGIYINPDKSTVFSLKEGDWLITLAEDES